MKKIDNARSSAFNKHFPEFRVIHNKWEHKKSNWITSGIIKPIEYRDNIYKQLKMCSPENPEHDLPTFNLKRHNDNLTQCISKAKKECYVHVFTKYRNDGMTTRDAS